MFNLSKYSQQLETDPNAVLDETEDLANDLQKDIDTFSQPKTQPDTDNNPLSEQLQPDEQRMSDMLASQRALEVFNDLIKKYPAETQGKLYSLPAYQQAQKDSANFDPGSFGFDSSPANKARFSQLEEISKSNPRFDQVVTQFTAELAEVDQNQRQFTNLRNSVPTPGSGNNFNLGFNLKRWKVAQNSSFPVRDAADLAYKFMNRLVTNDPNEFALAADEILSAVRGEIQEEEINSMVESLRSLDPARDQDQALGILGKMYNLLPEHLKATTEAPASMENQVMSKNNPKGIIKFDLSNHVLNNRQSSDENIVGMIKTAADQFGQQYLLYGPTEKRICPKLRGKGGGQPGSGDVVSEYICRHHCLDGIVIDDNKTICGEALWRANVMDKQSREYVDAEGNITGGYIEKRFQVDHNVPEENKMRLKPGETRKPRPPAWGNIESRLQDMRKKEADKRDYRPDSNTGDPFEWCHDQDQNNVEQSQSERDRREEAMGHKTVQYTNKAKQENNPKTASKKSFNLKQFKTASNWNNFEQEKFDATEGKRRISGLTDDGLLHTLKDLNEVIQIQEEGNRSGEMTTPKLGYYYDERHAVLEEMKRRGLRSMPSKIQEGHTASTKLSQKCNCGKDKCDCKKAFNLKNYKVAQGSGIPMPMDGANQDRFLKTPKRRKPMLTPESESPRHPLGMQDYKPVTNEETLDIVNQITDKSEPETPDTPVTMPGGDIVDPEEAERRKLKTLANDLMDFNTGTGTATQEVANSWTTGQDAEAPTMKAAIKELEVAVRGGLDESDAQRANNLIETLTELVTRQEPDQDHLGDEPNTDHGWVRDYTDDDFNQEHTASAWWMKESKKKYNPWAVCNKSTGGKSEGEDKFERCVHHVKDQDKDMKSCPCASSDSKKKK